MIEDNESWYDECPKETIKMCSYDDENGVYLSDSEAEVINFDKVKEEFIKPKNLREICSNDVLYYNENENLYYFIEFKNGKIKSETKKNLRTKIYDSYIIFFQKFNLGIESTRINYILVYNEEKNPHSRSSCLSGAIAGRAEKQMVRFGLNKFDGYLFNKMFTVSQDEFEEKFIEKWFSIV
ncbi:hypothetical protein [Lactococcus lactis]|uniref:hypothetical protein n=1 Tax=Lactococcus lactis TaxID=1358 RepID=UPI0022E1F160|nr:hypothetical protein [Lactococcus lactis]